MSRTINPSLIRSRRGSSTGPKRLVEAATAANRKIVEIRFGSDLKPGSGMTWRRIRGKGLMTNSRLGPYASHRDGAQHGEGRSVSVPLRVVGLERYPTASIYSY